MHSALQAVIITAAKKQGSGVQMIRKATVCEKLVTIPTYAAGAMEKNPMFLEKRAYQGSTGKVYPFEVSSIDY